MERTYQSPSWAVPPTQGSWSLSEVKGGVEVAQYSLNKSCTLLGRASNDIALAHESCSRWHARIAFDASGVPWLRDLASSHGTTVNKRKLPAAACGKMESDSRQKGSRGVILYPGDILQFGASTRMYCLEGPVEYERGAVRKAVPPATTLNQTQVAPAPPDKAPTEAKEKGVSWGMDMEDHVEAHGDDKKSLPAEIDPEKIPDKHRKAWEHLNAKRYKLQNVELESERIRAKGELSHGQVMQLQRNDERITKWKEEIAEMEQELHDKLYPDKRVVHKRHHHHHAKEDEDVDDFYDETKSDSSSDSADDGETESSLTKRWKQHLNEWKQCNGPLSEAEHKVEVLSRQIQSLDPNDEDAFFLQNDLDLAKDTRNKVRERKEKEDRALKETERLLRIVNDKLQIDRETGFIGEEGKRKAPSPAASSPVRAKKTVSVMQRVDEVVMPPPPPHAKPSATSSSMPPPPPVASSLPSAEEQGKVMLPPPKRRRVVGPTMPPPEAGMPPPSFKKRPSAAPMGTLSVLSAGTSSSASGAASPRKNKSKKGTPGDTFDPKKDVWKAPEDQDGSGITKLNAKFAGRY